MALALRTSLAVLLVACSAPATPRVTAPPSTPKLSPPLVVAPPPDAAPAQFASDVPGLRLPKAFVATGYTATLTIDPSKPKFTGHVVLAGTVVEPTSVVWLHARGLEFSGVIAVGTPTLTRQGEDLIALRLDAPLQPGPWSVTFDYTGAIDPMSTVGMFAQKSAGSTYVYSQFEAIHARRVFPCIDEPDSKVPWQLTIDVPNGNIAVSNTPLLRETANGTLRRFEFAQTKPLSTYLVAFGVGPFDIVDGGKTKSNVPVRIVTLKGRAPEAAYAAQSTARVLDLLETWFGMKYPYEKLDLLTLPLGMDFGAMENAGLVTYVESAMLFDPKTISLRQRHSFITTVAHELAHQWFGDLVTIAWWDDLWLNEGFADWLETTIAAQFEPAWHNEQQGAASRERALGADSVVTARKIRQPIETADDIESGFDGITYSKGASVLAMFDAYVGSKVFQQGVRAYVKARAFANATSTDFVGAINTAAGKDLTPAFASFLEQVGAPELDTKLTCDKAGATIELAQHRYVAPGSPDVPAQTWQVPVCVGYEQGGKRASACTLLTEATGTLALPGKGCPRWILPNLAGTGYYRVRYTQAQAQALRDEAWDKLTPVERRVVYLDVTATMAGRDKRLPLALVLSFIPKLLARPDRFSVAAALGLPLSFERQIPDKLSEKYVYYLRTTFGPGAAKVGFAAAPTDTLDDEGTRNSLIGVAAWHGRDPDLIAKALELAKDWRSLPTGVRVLVLQIAVDADANVAAHIMGDVRTETDLLLREEMFSALAAQRDPKRYEAALELLFDKAVDPREAIDVLFGTSVESTRVVAERFLRAHEAKILARLPTDSMFSLSGQLAGVLSASCDKAKRDEAKTYSLAHFAKLPGGERRINQRFERMDQCIANRELIGSELAGWLSGIRLPRKH